MTTTTRDRSALSAIATNPVHRRREWAAGEACSTTRALEAERCAAPGDRRDRSFGLRRQPQRIPTDETERLIASNKVEGTPVSIETGTGWVDRQLHGRQVPRRVVYAVLKHSSGFLGLDERYYPLDWDQLTYDTRLGGYHIDLAEDQLRGRGSWDRSERWQDRDSGLRSDERRAAIATMSGGCAIRGSRA